MAAIMPTLLSGIANGARQGILFKNGAQLEKIGKVRAIAFDKTGTLTTGQVQVSQVIAATDFTSSDVLKTAAAVESSSEHPIGKAIVQAAGDLDWVHTVEVQAVPGRGIVGTAQQQKIIVGNAAFVQGYVESLPEELQKTAQSLEEKGKTVVWVAQKPTSQESQGIVVGLIAIADQVRAEAAATITRLRKLGVAEIVMLTGDNQRTAHSVAQAVGIESVYAELLPEDKLDVIRSLQKHHQTVAMVGDGINDAPALAQAAVGVAMGVAGSDVALETADIVLMADKLEKIAVAIDLGRRSHNIIKQNITVALSCIVLLLIGNFLGNINLPIGVIGHEGSTVLVTLSGLRLLKR
jgi:Cd2+/Zn2+-exporting ATPase